MRITKEAKNWTDWINTIEGWTSDIEKNWGNKEQNNSEGSDKEYTLEYLENLAYQNRCEQEDSIAAIEYIANIFPKFNKNDFRNLLNGYLLDFIKTKNDFENGPTERIEAKPFIDEYIRKTELIKLFDIYGDFDDENLGILIVLEPKIFEILNNVFFIFLLPCLGY